MTKEKFDKIKSKANLNKLDRDEVEFCNIAFNVDAWKYWYEHDFDRVIYEILFDGNTRNTIKKVEYILEVLLTLKVFTDEQWNNILPHIDIEEFWSDVKTLDKKVIKMFNKLIDYSDDVELEFWQGAFSKEKALWVNEDGINAWENGKRYCETIKKIKPHIEEFCKKYPNSSEFLSDRYC